MVFLSDWAPPGLCALQNPRADERVVLELASLY